MTSGTPLDISIRGYGVDGPSHKHDFAQLVLPISGSLNVEVEGREHGVTRGLAVFVAPSARHAQGSARGNRSIVLDMLPTDLGERLIARLGRSPCFSLDAATRKLLDYAQLVLGGTGFGPATGNAWASLLLASLDCEQTSPPPRLARLMADVEADPGEAWAVEAMAAQAGLSIRRLHAVFRRDMASTPHAWLLKLRMDRIVDDLYETDTPIAQLAFRYGFADQSALTRAFRQQTGFTPAAYRRQRRT